MSTVSDVNPTARRAATLALTVVMLTACERPQPDSAPLATPGPVADTTTVPTSESTTPPITDAPEPSTSTMPQSTVPPTSAAPPTMAPTTEPTAPTSPTIVDPETPSGPVLDFDGILPFAFGAPDTEIVAGLIGVLGEPVSDESTEYPTDEAGTFLDASGEEAYVAPFGRTVCFANALCAQFGAGSDTALQFTGWRFEGDAATGLATAGGITIGSRWADHVDAITIDEGGCSSVGYGSAEGIELTLQSSGEPFVTLAGDGSFSAGSPDPADVSVIGMQAGDLPVSLLADC